MKYVRAYHLSNDAYPAPIICAIVHLIEHFYAFCATVEVQERRDAVSK